MNTDTVSCSHFLCFTLHTAIQYMLSDDYQSCYSAHHFAIPLYYTHEIVSGGSRIFCLGANRTGIFVWGAKGGLSAEGAKLQLPKARSPSRLGVLGESCKFPHRGLGRSPRNRHDFEHFKPEWSTFWDPVNLTFLNN